MQLEVLSCVPTTTARNMHGAGRLKFTRRQIVTLMSVVPIHSVATAALAHDSENWSAQQTQQALLADSARLLDIRSRKEWRDTGVAHGAWPVSMHEPRFPARLFAAHALAENRPLALICAVGGRSGTVIQALRQAGYDGFVDVSEGMLGSPAGPGWIASGLPIVSIDEALSKLPQALL